MLVEEVSVPYLGFFSHVGLRFTFPDGRRFAYACAPGLGVVRQSEERFSGGRAVRARRARTVLHPHEVLRRAESTLGRPYDLLRWNCEHFVEFCLGRRPVSGQLRVAAAVGLVGFALVGARK